MQIDEISAKIPYMLQFYYDKSANVAKIHQNVCCLFTETGYRKE